MEFKKNYVGDNLDAWMKFLQTKERRAPLYGCFCVVADLECRNAIVFRKRWMSNEMVLQVVFRNAQLNEQTIVFRGWCFVLL